MVVPMPSRVPAEELFQMRLVLERSCLAGDLGDKQLLSSINWLQAACGEKQLTPQALASIISQLHDEDAALRQHAASTLSILASRSVFNQFRIAAQPSVTESLVRLLSDEVSWVRGSAAAALTHLAMQQYHAMQTTILQQPGAITALVQLLQDKDAGLGCAAAIAIRTLAQDHPKNQSLIGMQPGAISGLVNMTLGEDSALRAMAHAALKRLAANHPVNRARIRHEYMLYNVSGDCQWPLLDDACLRNLSSSGSPKYSMPQSNSSGSSSEVCCC